MKKINFQSIITRQQVSTRGGGVEIDLTTLGFPGERMAAYQNHLGGGMLGAVCVNDTIRRKGRPFIEEEQAQKLDAIGNQLKRYYFELTNPEEGWESVTFEQNQAMPKSGY